MTWALLEGLSEGDREQLLASTRTRRFQRREVVFHQQDAGDEFHLVARGRLAVQSSTSGGDIVTLMVVGPGDFFGELALLEPGARRNATVVCLEPAETLVLTGERFNELRQAYPSVNSVLVEALAARLRRLTDVLVEALYFPVETRLLRRLIEIAEEWGWQDENGRLDLTQEDLALMAGTTRPTVNRVLQRSAQQGAIALGRGHIDIIDLDRLRALAR
ncbi:MAG TPA: Crp/Fnr family transcriptional regulator [Acidimicrobiia bacterium]